MVLPRGPNSLEVFIAHLGRINVCNKNVEENTTNNLQGNYSESRTEFYEIEIRDMNLFSLDTSTRRVRDKRKDQTQM